MEKRLALNFLSAFPTSLSVLSLLTALAASCRSFEMTFELSRVLLANKKKLLKCFDFIKQISTSNVVIYGRNLNTFIPDALSQSVTHPAKTSRAESSIFVRRVRLPFLSRTFQFNV